MVLLSTKELELKQYSNRLLKKLESKFLGSYRVLERKEECIQVRVAREFAILSNSEHITVGEV
jgi:hypothetical protein